ncbi:MAG: helix-turn-helix domain-containing protein [Bacteroidales bacterium]|jgi:AraC-like DNA-binding protein|nr:helix-turn-helix domain-containing protein [Bacteroidales bacterium]
MTSKFLTRLIFFFVLIQLFSSIGSEAAIQTPQDSIRENLPTLKGAERLQALLDIVSLEAMGDDLQAELEALKQLRTEAEQQKNRAVDGLSRVKEIFCYYNYKQADSIEKYLPEHLAFMAQHQQWDNYYNSWEAKIELYLYADKTQTALKETQLMYEDAKARNNNYGLSVSAHSLGVIYQTLQRYDLAIQSFDEAVERLKKEENVSLLLSTYNTLSETLDANHQFDRMLQVAEQWKKTIDDYKAGAEARGHTPQLNGRYMYCYLALTVAHFQTGNSTQAEEFLKMAEKLAEGRGLIAQFKLLHIQTRFYEHSGQYDKAIAYAEENYDKMIGFGDNISALTVLENKARLLRKADRGIDAALTYEQVMLAKDSLRNLDMAAQLDELRTIYEMDQLLLEKEVAKSRAIIMVLIIVSLVVLLLGYGVYNFRLKRKNRILYENIKRAQQAEADAGKAIDTLKEDRLSKEQVLFRELNNLFREKLLFTDPKLDRKEIAQLLGTNTTYLANAIKECAKGMTVNEYINKVRLLYAGNLLMDSVKLPVDIVGEDAGFSSRSTYYRLFRDYYGMSPTEFRNISKEKRKKGVA